MWLSFWARLWNRFTTYNSSCKYNAWFLIGFINNCDPFYIATIMISVTIESTGCVHMTHNDVFCQGNLDWHGNPSWFSGLQDESNFQTKISQKWLEILRSFFHIMKIWYSGLHLALVTWYYPNLSKNGSRLKKSVKKFEFCFWAKLVNFQHF